MNNITEMTIYRDKQFENVEGLFTWYDDIMSNYEAAFWVHYRILCRVIEVWIEEVKNNSDIPRVTYFVNTEYMSMVLCELLLTIETLFKAELSRAGGEVNKTHRMIELMDKMVLSGNDRCATISEKFDFCRDFLSRTDADNAFVNVRYLDSRKVILDSEVASDIKKLVIALDEVYKEFYSDFSISKLLYLGMMFDEDDENLSEDEKRRLKNVGLL